MYFVESSQPLTIVSEKYDGRPHVEWPSYLICKDARGLVTLAPFGTALIHHTRGLLLPQDHSCLSLFPRDRWWNAQLDFDAEGRFLSAYCNVAQPYRREAQFVRWPDLDLDVLMMRDQPANLLDEDEFAEHSQHYGYPAETIAKARAAANDLLDRASRGAIPFRQWTLDEAVAYVKTTGGW